jgi:hypothetical protein
LKRASPPKLPPPEARTETSNFVLWVVFFCTLLGTSAYFMTGVYVTLSWNVAIAIVEMLLRTGILVASGLALEALLIRVGDGFFTLTKSRRVVLHTYWVGVMFLSVALVVDVINVGFAGYHLTTSFRILFSDGPTGVGQVIEATGLSTKSFLVGGAAILGGLTIAVFLSKWSRRLSIRLGFYVSRRMAIQATLTTIGLLALLELSALPIRDPYLWQRELRRVPLAFSIIRPRAELASLRARVRPPIESHAQDLFARKNHEGPRPDVFIIIIESLRKDAVTFPIMPHMSEFARDAWTFEHPIAAGNVTHYSWYGLINSQYPIYFDTAKANSSSLGSLPLARLRQAGYRIHLLATPDTRYQHLDTVLFGASDPNGRNSLIDSHFRPAIGNVADRDQAVVVELERQLRTTPKGGHVYILGFDSSHFDYVWGADYTPKFIPYAKTIPITHDYSHDPVARRLVVNRYKNSVAWVDSLLGRTIDAIESTLRLEQSIIFITGDHGESFWEHETGTHGSNLMREQLEVGFVMKLPGRTARHSDTIFSLMDVMPTVLDELDLDSSELGGKGLRDHEGSAYGITFQGWNEQAYHFSLTLPKRRLLFELDHAEPLRSQRLILADVTNLDDVSLIEEEHRATDDSEQNFLRELPEAVDQLTFMEL